MIISFLLVCRNEESFIASSIEMIIKEMQCVGGKDSELIVVDGCSTDRTVPIAEEKQREFSDYSVKILNNPQETLATGWNIGIKAAKGKFVIRPDAHGGLLHGYAAKGISILAEHPEVAAVGGVLKTVGRGWWGEIIKEALSSPIGVGNSAFRTGIQAGYTDTAVFAVYRKRIFDEVGFFNEKLIRHQDNDMHFRIKKAGWKFWTEPEMKAIYYCRETPPELFDQMFKIGRYLPYLIFEGSVRGINLRNFAPLVFYAFNIIMLTISIYIINWFFMLPYLIYISIVLLFAIITAIKERTIRYLNVFEIVIGMHIFYAIGTFVGSAMTALKLLRKKQYD